MKRYLLVLLILSSFMLEVYSQKKQLLIFVGKRIEFVKDTIVDTTVVFEPDRYIVTYQVVQLLKGNLEKDTISCYTHDEFNIPPELTSYEHALVFLYKWNGEFEYYHDCMHYCEVCKTKDNRWASHYASSHYAILAYGSNTEIQSSVKPEKILFEKELSVDLIAYNEEYIKHYYPSPYYEIRDNKAIAVYGNYLEDVLKLCEESFNSRGFTYD